MYIYTCTIHFFLSATGAAPPSDGDNGSSGGMGRDTIVGIVLGVVFFIYVVFFRLCCFLHLAG